MNKKIRSKEIISKLWNHYGEIECALTHKNAFELLIATILSAQCTDKRVNMVTPILFSKYPTPKDLAGAKFDEVIEIIRSTGFFNNKSKNIIGCAKKIMEKFNGSVPSKMDELITLPGVARKTANVVLSCWFNKPAGIAVDTHVKRLSRLLGLTENTDPNKIEQDLMKLYSPKDWSYISLGLIQYGRDYCKATKHDQSKCFLGH